MRHRHILLQNELLNSVLIELRHKVPIDSLWVEIECDKFFLAHVWEYIKEVFGFKAPVIDCEVSEHTIHLVNAVIHFLEFHRFLFCFFISCQLTVFVKQFCRQNIIHIEFDIIYSSVSYQGSIRYSHHKIEWLCL